jgi:hypothetical protein
MVGNSRKNYKGERISRRNLLDNPDVGRWFGNLEAKLKVDRTSLSQGSWLLLR